MTGVLLVFGAPCQLLLLEGPQHGRTIPLADMSRPLLLRCAAPTSYTSKIYGTGAWRNSYSPAWAANVSMTAIFGNRFDGRPYRSFRYSGLLYESQTFPRLTACYHLALVRQRPSRFRNCLL